MARHVTCLIQGGRPEIPSGIGCLPWNSTLYYQLLAHKLTRIICAYTQTFHVSSYSSHCPPTTAYRPLPLNQTPYRVLLPENRILESLIRGQNLKSSQRVGRFWPWGGIMARSNQSSINITISVTVSMVSWLLGDHDEGDCTYWTWLTGHSRFIFDRKPNDKLWDCLVECF